MSKLDLEAIRRDAEKWCDRATAEGAYTDPKAEQTLALLNEIEVLRRLQVATGWIVCPRCEGQTHDVGECGLCLNLGWLDENGAALTSDRCVEGSSDTCACGQKLITCEKCGDSRCLSCDPYSDLDTCGERGCSDTRLTEALRGNLYLYRIGELTFTRLLAALDDLAVTRAESGHTCFDTVSEVEALKCPACAAARADAEQEQTP